MAAADEGGGDGPHDVVAAELLHEFRGSSFVDERRAVPRAEHGATLCSSSAEVSDDVAERFLLWLVHPVSADDLYDKFWERKPFVVTRPHLRNYYDDWFGKKDIESLLEAGKLEYGTGVDVTLYENFERQTLNQSGIASPSYVWEKFSAGCSVRVLHPQRWSDRIWSMLSILETHWNTVAGCNVYLTPAGSQGFSPHYDDIEAFILQVEGTKHWKCYKPRSQSEVLPRFSSGNFTQEEIGEPILEVDLEPGDLLFMPRGTIHQAVAHPDCHSLHITVSAGQRNSWADYLELAMPRAVELAAEEHAQLRGSLPRNLFDFMGVVHQGREGDSNRAAFMNTLTSFFDLLMESGPWDSAVDQMAVQFVHKRLPLPQFSAKPKAKKKKMKQRREKVTIKSRVKFAAPGIARLVMEEDAAVVHHMMDNKREEHNVYVEEVELEEGDGGESKAKKRTIAETEDLSKKGTLRFDVESIEILDQLMVAYPNSMAVEEIEGDEDDVMETVETLIGKGILVVENV